MMLSSSLTKTSSSAAAAAAAAAAKSTFSRRNLWRFWVVAAVILLALRNFSSVSVTSRRGLNPLLVVVLAMVGNDDDNDNDDDTQPEQNAARRNSTTIRSNESTGNNNTSEIPSSSWPSQDYSSHNKKNLTRNATTETSTFSITSPTSSSILRKPSSLPLLLPRFSACLLIKDDNDILNEWIAYHYHLWNLRHLVVAVDPTSQTSPQPLLDRWAQIFSSENTASTTSIPSTSPSSSSSSLLFQYVLWNDTDYMPERFVRGDYSQVKAHLGKLPQRFPNRTFTPDEIRHISNHRFRQKEFYRKCLQYLDQVYPPPSSSSSSSPPSLQENKTNASYYSGDDDDDDDNDNKNNNNNNNNNRATGHWIAHMDTDEYLSLNPWLASSPVGSDDDEGNESSSAGPAARVIPASSSPPPPPPPPPSSSTSASTVLVLQQRRSRVRAVQPTAGALLELLVQDQREHPNDDDDDKNKNQHAPLACVGLPRLLFGGVEQQQQQQQAGDFHLNTHSSSNNNNNNTTTTASSSSWNDTMLESIRWKYHAPMAVTAGSLNGQPKALLNWDALSKRQRQRFLQDIHSIHRPHKGLCPKSVSIMTMDDDGGGPTQSPPSSSLTIYHYLGSMERYLSREDPRRTREMYISKANQTEGPISNQMNGWLEQFAQDHGFDKISQVMADYLVESYS